MLAPLLFATRTAIELVAGWTTHGPFGVTGNVAAAAGPSRRVFATLSESGASAIYRSDDGGSRWQRVADAPPAEHYVSVAVDPRDSDRLFAATDHAGFSGFTTRIYQSSDGGENWSLRLSEYLASGARIVFDSFARNTVYATYDGRAAVSRSTDGGMTFSDIPAPFDGAVLASTLDGALLAASGQSIWVSRDHADSWTPVAAPALGCPIRALAVDPASGRWWIGSGDPDPGCGDVLWSDDEGGTWTLSAAFGVPVADLAADPAGGNRLYVAMTANIVVAGGHVLVTSDGGATWNDLRIPVSAGASQLAVSGDGSRLHAATPAGVFERDLRRPRVPAPR